jgi:ubiquinone/menaquinone biosynthesis C-methylase UbiE
MAAGSSANFERVNQLTTDASVIEFLEVTEALAFTQDCKSRMRTLAPPAAGAHVLDVGCGLGHEIRRLGAIAGASGRAVGLDANAVAIAEARRRVAAVRDAPEFFHGSAEQMPFDDASFDLVRAERVAEYVDSPPAMFAEMARVLRAGGRMAVFDFDYSGSIVDAADRRIAEQVQRIVAGAVPNPWIGGALRRCLVNAGLREVRIEPISFVMPFELYYAMTAPALSAAAASGRIDARALAQWWAGLQHAHRSGHFFASLTGMIAVGSKAP